MDNVMHPLNNWDLVHNTRPLRNGLPSPLLLGRKVDRNALSLMHADFNKRHIVSLRLSRKLHYQLWQEILKIKVIKCPLTLLLNET